MRRHLAALVAALVAAAAFCFTIVGTAAPANAEISFCTTGKNSPCIGPVNGCTLKLGTPGRYGFAENGDTIIADDGNRYRCFNGKWVKDGTTRPQGTDVNMGFMLGAGLLTQGPSGPPTPPCNPNQTFCP